MFLFHVVYNWTVDDVVDWLQKEVDLPQYSSIFTENSVSGPFLPRYDNDPPHPTIRTLASSLKTDQPVLPSYQGVTLVRLKGKIWREKKC